MARQKFATTPDGVTYRVGTSDLQVAASIVSSYGWLRVRGRNVLDVGAHIGAFSRWACDYGARCVVGYEPLPENYELALRNAPNANIRRAALRYCEEGPCKLYVAPNRVNLGSTSTVPMRGRDVVEAWAQDFRAVLRGLRPSVIKMDCEGAEYDLLQAPLPGYVRQVALELHLNRKEWRDMLAPKVVAMFADWETVVEPKLGGGHWHVLAGWRR